ncbi:MAG: hypothetical protein HC874_30415 [Richelia sp. SL_2_1]|nr:hypothetical protein [Richelia sp. SL_2_1]
MAQNKLYGTKDSLTLWNKDTTSITIGGVSFEFDKVYEYNRPDNQIVPDEIVSEINRILAIEPDFITSYTLPDDFNWEWNLTKKDSYGMQGSLIKRISSYFFKYHKIKVSAEILSRIGNLLSKELKTETVVSFDLTNNLERNPDYFYYGNSCWFNAASNGRYLLMDLGGGAVRSLYDLSYPRGRCWYVPVKDNKCIALFNEYGNEALFSYARMLSAVSGLSYRRANLYDTNKSMYINRNGNCYIVGEPEHLTDTDYYTSAVEDKYSYSSYSCEYCNRCFSRNRLKDNYDINYRIGTCLNCGKVD